MEAKSIKQSRFELRLSQEERKLFEKAAQLSGYTSLASFVSSILKKEAQKVIKKHEKILVSQRDKEIFFDAILSQHQANEKLQNAAQKYLAKRQTQK